MQACLAQWFLRTLGAGNPRGSSATRCVVPARARASTRFRVFRRELGLAVRALLQLKHDSQKLQP